MPRVRTGSRYVRCGSFTRSKLTLMVETLLTYDINPKEPSQGIKGEHERESHTRFDWFQNCRAVILRVKDTEMREES